jgi:hypothetical protein
MLTDNGGVPEVRTVSSDMWYALCAHAGALACTAAVLVHAAATEEKLGTVIGIGACGIGQKLVTPHAAPHGPPASSTAWQPLCSSLCAV